MLSELRVFDNIPRYLMSPDRELRQRAINMLSKELERREVRRPWGSIEPFVVALYHVTFVDRDLMAGKILLRYLDRVLPRMRSLLPLEVQEVADIILYAVRAEIEEFDRNSTIKIIQDYKTTTLISELVKKVVLIELKGEYDETLDELVEEISNVVRRKLWYLRNMLEEPVSSDIIEHFLLDLDITNLSGESTVKYTIHNYFTVRARELRIEYMKRKRIIDMLVSEYEELRQEYNKVIDDLTDKIETWLPILIDFVTAILLCILNMLYNSWIIMSGSIIGLIVLILFTVVKQLRNIINPYISTISRKIANWIVRFTRKGGKLAEEIKYKKRMIEDLKHILKRLR